MEWPSPINISVPWSEDVGPVRLDADSQFFSENVKVLSDHLFTEAVFSNGRQTVEPILKCIQECKDELMKRIGEQDDSVGEITDWYKLPPSERRGQPPKRKNFDPVAYWKAPCWKNLEDKIVDVFGFRTVSIQPYKEKYNSKDKDFETKELNAFIYSNRTRYPVEALVTDKGLFDKSRSLVMDMVVTLGVMKELTAEQILAVMLHEMGHGIDPALVDIRFLETNILSKYITDRKGKINNDEKKIMKKNKLAEEGIIVLAYLFLVGLMFLPNIINGLKRLFMGKEKYDRMQQEKRIKRIKDALTQDRRQFNRQVYSEAFADNFARMYGYGAHLMAGLHKIGKNIDDRMLSRYHKESARQELITQITIWCLGDEHKTDIHRIRNLLREYDNDIKDPNVPEAVKKQLREDKEELEAVLNAYLNDNSAFQNRVNQMLNEELKKLDDELEKKAGKKDTETKKPSPSSGKIPQEKITQKEVPEEEPVTEGVEYFDESKKAYQSLMEREKTISSSERAEAKKLFPDAQCSFAKDKDGYYCYTHRCRSKSYPSISKIPKSKVDFVSSTS